MHNLSDLKLGMTVRVSNLDDIRGVWIIIKNPHFVTDENGFADTEGIIHKISHKRLRVTENNTALVYNTPYDEEDLIDAYR